MSVKGSPEDPMWLAKGNLQKVGVTEGPLMAPSPRSGPQSLIIPI